MQQLRGEDDPQPILTALAERYGGILGLPVLFVIGCDGRIEHRVDGETDLALLERQIETLLEDGRCSAVKRRR